MSSNPNPPIPPAKSKSGSGAGIITGILAVLCIVLAVVAITLYSGKDAAERGKAAAEASLKETESKLEAATSDAQRARTETQNVLRERASQFVAIAQLPTELRGTPGEVAEKIRQLASGISPVQPAAGGTARASIPGGVGGAGAGSASDPATQAMEAVASRVVRQSFDTKADPGTDQQRILMHRQIQTALARIGAFTKPVSGNQKDTMEAVMAFQRANKLKVDGVVGRNTWGKVREKFEAMARAGGAPSAPAPAPTTGAAPAPVTPAPSANR